MNPFRRATLLCAVLVIGVVGCAAPTSPAPSTPRPASSGPAPAATPKRIVAVILADLPTFSGRLNSPLPGSTEIEDFVNAGMVTVDVDDVIHPQLAEAIPSLDNGSWKLLTDATSNERHLIATLTATSAKVEWGASGGVQMLMGNE